MATIEQDLAQIRQAVYGEEVREAIADGIEQCYQDSTANAQIERIVAKGQETYDSIPSDYSALSDEVDDLKSAIDYIPESILAIGGVRPLIFTPGCYDTPATGTAVTRKENAIRVTAYAPISPGDIIIVDATGGSGYQRLYVFIDADGNAVGDRSPTNWSGKRTLTAPAGAVAVAINNDTTLQPTGYYAYIGDAITDSAFMDRGIINSGITSLSSLTKIGAFLVASGLFASLDDMPATAASNYPILILVLPTDIYTYQIAYQKEAGYQWMRRINQTSGTAESWVEMGESRNLTVAPSGDANNIVWNGFYGWGSSDTVANVPGNTSSGMIININRDQNTKYQFGIRYSDNALYLRSKKSGVWGDWARPYHDAIASLQNDSFMSKGDVGSDVTALSGFTGIGHWFIAATRVTALTDKPDNMPARASILAVYPYDGGVWQYLWQKDTAYCWIRAINTSTQAVGAWTELRDSRNLTTVQDGDANNVVWNGYYGWGSSDSVSHVPNGVNAGTLVNINRDQNTKYQFAISYQDGHVYVRSKKLGTWYDWNQLVYTSDIVSSDALKPLIKYESGSFDSGKATERLLIYLPCKDHYVCYYFYHYVVADINCNCWQIYNIYKVSADFATSTLLTTSGEFECAVKLDGRSNFSGGSTHGNEIMTGWDLFVDGSRKTANLSSLADRTEFKEIRFVRQSNLYDPNGSTTISTTIIADHGCEYVFDGETGTLKINQSLKWRGAYALENCFLAMFTPRKSVTDHGYTDVDFTPIALTSEEYTVDVPGAKKAVIYGENTDFCAEFAIERYPELASGNKFRFTDNNGLSYNKCYFFVASGGTSSVGELWQSTTVYKVEA